MSGGFGPADWETSIETIHLAAELGANLLDTANVYGFGHNEVLVGRAIAGRRDDFVVATKLGVDRSGGGTKPRYRGDTAYVRQALEESLLRLGTDLIDIYYVHRPSTEVPIEETVGAMSEAVQAGKIRLIGLSGVEGELIKRAATVHQIAVVQLEYSLWARAVEGLAPTLAELGIGLVPYSPLGRGFLTGTLTGELHPTDKRNRTERLFEQRRTGESLLAVLEHIAHEHGVPTGSVALAWLYGQRRKFGVPIIPIPGTKRPRWLIQNVAAEGLTLSDSELEMLESASAAVA